MTFTNQSKNTTSFTNNEKSPPTYDFLLQENGDYLFLESGDKIILEQTSELGSQYTNQSKNIT